MAVSRTSASAIAHATYDRAKADVEMFLGKSDLKYPTLEIDRNLDIRESWSALRDGKILINVGAIEAYVKLKNRGSSQKELEAVLTAELRTIFFGRLTEFVADETKAYAEPGAISEFASMSQPAPAQESTFGLLHK